MKLIIFLFLSYKYLVIPDGNFKVLLNDKEINPLKTGWIRNVRIGIFDVEDEGNLKITGGGGNYKIDKNFREILEKIVVNKQDIKKFAYRLNVTQNLYELPFEKAIKIYTKKEGIYRVYGNILRNIGVDIDTLLPQNAHLFYRGREIPLKFKGEEDGIFNDGDYIEFIAQRINGKNTYYNVYTDFNSYFLYFDYEPGLRFLNKNMSSFDSTNITSSLYKIYHFEKDSVFMDFTQMRVTNTDSFDLWYWKVLSLNKPETLLFKIEKPGVQRVYKVKFYFETFETENVNYPEHGIELKINDNFTDTIFWGGNAPHIDSIIITGDILIDGYNYIVLKEDSLFSNIAGLLNWIEIEGTFAPEFIEHFYKIEPSQDTFSVILKGGRKNKIRLFFYPSIEYGEIEGKFKNNEYEYELTFEPFSSGYYFVSDTFFIPESLEVYHKEEIINPSQGADVIVITHPDFYEKALIYKNYRESQGYSVKVVKLTDIYNQFSYGIKSPDAIKEFLKNAIFKWIPSPFAVLLLGDASYDPKNIENPSKDFIPTFLYPARTPDQAVYYSRPASTDIYYTLLVGDDPFPDILLGRIPVNSLNECDIYLNKVIQYEQNPEFGWWRVSPYLLTEVHPQDGTVFYEACEKLKEENIPEEYDSRVIALSTLSGFKGYTFPQILGEVSKGSPVITFIGHASTSFRTIFRNKTFKAERWYDVYNFKKTPLFVAMSCWVGDFAGFSERYSWYDPGKSFLELPLMLSGRGIIGYMAVTASSPSPQYSLNKNITYLLPEGVLKGLYNYGIKESGGLHLFSRLHSLLYISSLSGESKNVYYTFNLIGDPLLKLPVPEVDSIILNPVSLMPHDTIFISSNPESIPYGRAIERLKVLDNDTGYTLYKLKEYNSLPFMDTIPVNYSGFNAKGEVRIYFFNPSSELKEKTGFANFSLNGAFAQNTEFIPPLPDSEYHYIKSIIKSVRNMDTVFLLWSYGDSLGSPYFVNLQKTGDTFVTQNAIGPLYPGNKFSISFYIIDTTGISFYTDTFKYRVPFLADLSASRIDVIPDVENKNLNIIFPIVNGGERDADDFKYCFKIVKRGDTVLSKVDSISLIPFASESISISINDTLYYGSFKIYYNIDSDNRVPESNEYNNSMIIDNFENPYLYFIDSTSWIYLSDSLQFRITNQDTNIFEIRRIDSFQIHPGIEFIDTLSGISIKDFLNTGTEKDSLILFKFLSPPDSLELFRFERDSLWHSLERIPDSSFVLWVSQKTGVFSFGYLKDKKGPELHVLWNGEELKNNQKLKKGSGIGFLFSDSSGIDLFYRKPEILLDGVNIFDSLTFNKGIQNPKTISSSYKLKALREGLHNIDINIYDCLGNLSQKTVSFLIFEPFDIIFKGIYPNPVRDKKTVIAFENTKDLNSIKVKIITTAGREIYEFDPYMDPVRPPLTRKGNHWLEWFLQDKWGNKVANGVYLLYIEGKWKDKTKKIIQKIGVLQ